MSDSDFNNKTAMAAPHAVSPRSQLRVAPTDGTAAFNAIRLPLIPVGCWRLNDPGFAFDSSFVAPEFRDGLAALSTLVAANQACPAALFAHCDPAGSDALNKVLGDRRAIAVYALLTRQPDLWASLYDDPQVGDTWGTPAIQLMLASITGRSTDDQGNPVDPTTTPYYGGAVDGKYGPATTAAVKAFQSDCGLTSDGQAGHQTRKVLFGAYMDWLCTPAATPDADAQQPSPPPAPFRMQPSDFLGGTGAQLGDLPKMSLQSCGKFNPTVLLPSSEMSQSDTVSRNVEDAPNRRVIMFLFPKGTTVDTGFWPCPKVKEANDACNGAFWPDGDQRRQNGDTRRVYADTRDTFACRFYDRFARRSPCEGGLRIRLLQIWPQGRDRQRMRSTPYRLTIAGCVREGQANDQGLIEEHNVPFQEQCTLEWGAPTVDESSSARFYPHARQLAVDVEANPQGNALGNLAYSDHQDPLAAFRADYGQDDLQTVHSDGIPRPEA